MTPDKLKKMREESFVSKAKRMSKTKVNWSPVFKKYFNNIIERYMPSEIVKQEYVGKTHWVSTVKLPSAYDGLNLGKYETVIQGYKGEWLDYTKRCETLDEARDNHEEAKLYVLNLERTND